ncbi:hypothetical protein N7510_006663 [Penicillium lagena]|uniref:uncharacterized protein n=1 Tax=Penicillium lagena TaxID=94218 RepID=UPI0025407A1E|nr:uncharacterized protein N7510_006663 [Penicillium lagena]KAJ5609944.1 hypothetical protein N7510_006663 [Penicillium lagena]
MEYEDLSSPRSSVKLSNQSQWQAWIRNIKYDCEGLQIWGICDPDGDETPMDPPIQPTEDDALALTTPGQKWAGTQVYQVYQVYQMMMTRYNAERSKFDNQTKGLYQIRKKINFTLDPSFHNELLQLESVREQLRAIRARFPPKLDPYYVKSIRKQWLDITKGPAKGIDMLKWLRQWETLKPEIIEAGWTTVQDSARLEFLEAIQTIAPEFYDQWDHEFTVNDKQTTFEELVTYFRGYWSQKSLQNSAASTTDETGNRHTDFTRQCPCGRKFHRPWMCYTLNPKARSQGYTVNKEAEKRTNDEVDQDPDYRKWLDEKIKAYNDAKANNSKANDPKPMDQEDDQVLYTGATFF